MKRIDILHIYAGTSGSAGLYIDSIYSALKSDFEQCVIVSYYFPFSYGKKIFYKYSDLSYPNISHHSDIIRLTIRYFELLYALTYSLIYILFKRPRIINYSLTTQINLEYFFLKILKRFSNSKIWITAHDVIPFQTNYSKYEKSLKQRKLFFLLADKIIVHNTNSIRDLKEYFEINEFKILHHPFPIMDLRRINVLNKRDSQLKKHFSPDIKNFVFVGHLRKEKGINILLEAWSKVVSGLESISNIQLIIAGNIPKGFTYNFSNIPNLVLLDNFLSDSDYRYLIEKAECVILPYSKGTNSGIPSSVITLNTKLITSDIEMFMSNDLIDKKFIFQSENSEALSEKIRYVLDGHNYNFNSVHEYMNEFSKIILENYKK